MTIRNEPAVDVQSVRIDRLDRSQTPLRVRMSEDAIADSADLMRNTRHGLPPIHAMRDPEGRHAVASRRPGGEAAGEFGTLSLIRRLTIEPARLGSLYVDAIPLPDGTTSHART